MRLEQQLWPDSYAVQSAPVSNLAPPSSSSLRTMTHSKQPHPLSCFRHLPFLIWFQVSIKSILLSDNHTNYTIYTLYGLAQHHTAQTRDAEGTFKSGKPLGKGPVAMADQTTTKMRLSTMNSRLLLVHRSRDLNRFPPRSRSRQLQIFTIKQ